MTTKPDGKKPYLLIGKDVRFLAENSVRHHHNVAVADYAGSWDTTRICPTRSISLDGDGSFDLRSLIELSRGEEYAGVIAGSGFENDIIALSKTAELGKSLGSSLEAVRKTRNPESLLRASHAWNFKYPDIFYKKKDIIEPGKWLAKPFSSLGGAGVVFADQKSESTPEGFYYQRFINGIASSAAIVSDGAEAITLGILTQIIGDEAFGANNFTHTGGVFPHPFGSEISKAVGEIADALTLEYDLKGLWGFDFVYNGVVNLVEINPRPTLGHGIVGCATWNDLLGLHIDSVTKKYSNLIVDPGATGKYYAQAKVFAKEETVFSSSAAWLERGARDIPFDGDIIAPGQPILTLSAESETYSDVLFSLREQAKELYDSFTTATTAPLF